MTPWSTEVRVEPDVADDVVVVSAMLSLDAGPMREFRPFLDIALDEAHATELLGKLTIALRDLRERQATNSHVRQVSA